MMNLFDIYFVMIYYQNMFKIVNNEEYYHIHKLGYCDDEWQVGKKFFIGNELNAFFSFYEKDSLTGKNIKIIKNYINNFHDPNFNPKIADLKLYFNASLDAINECAKFMREYLFEEVRKQFFSQYPSRTKCLWVIQSKEDLKYWRTILSGKLYRLRLTGKTFTGYERYLDIDMKAFGKWRELAFQYWVGDIEKTATDKEVLFEGFVEILEEIK